MNHNINFEKLKSLQNHIVVIKYGGSVIAQGEELENLVASVCVLKEHGIFPVVVHGGGALIGQLINEIGLHSEFIAGYRKTDERTMTYVEMALKGKVGGEIVKNLNRAGVRAVGISGKDGLLAFAEKKRLKIKENTHFKELDLGFVGDIVEINTELVHLLLNNDFVPVIAPVALGTDFKNYNINADIFAGHLAAALKARYYLILTDVDGIKIKKNGKLAHVHQINSQTVEKETNKSIVGGMLPKVESCIFALRGGVDEVFIINGFKKNIIINTLIKTVKTGTKIII